MATREFEVRTEDGRRLIAAVTGPENGELLLFHGGTPACRIFFDRHLRQGAERGLRHVTYSRPGYEGSDRQPGRTIADSAADSAAVVDALGVDSFYVIGLSGGGGPALACAALLPDRVRAATSVAALGPREGEGLDWLQGIAKNTVEEFEALEAGEAELQRFIEASVARMREIGSKADLRASFDGYLCDADLDCLSGDFLTYQLAGCKRIAYDGIWGWLDEDLAMWKPWGFELERITVPVTIWQGSDDRFVPVQNGRWLADRIPGAMPRILKGEGHLSLPCHHYGAMLDDLIASARS